MSVTLKEIAKAAGVYPSAVSAVLNNKQYTRISQERRDHIRQVADRMGYRPNFQASCLRRGKKATVGVFLPGWRDVLLYQLLKGLAAGAKQYEIPLTYDFGLTAEAYYKFISSMATFKHTAIISYVPFEDSNYGKILEQLERYINEGGKVISLNTLNWPMAKSLTLDIDEREGGRLAAEWLLARNCASYAVFSVQTATNILRNDRFAEEIAAHNRRVRVFPVSSSSVKAVSAVEQVDRLIGECERPVGIFCSTGQSFSEYLIFRCLERGWRYGIDYQLVGYDFGPRGGDYYQFPRIIQPFYRLGELAMERLDALLKGKNVKSEILTPTLQAGDGMING